MHCAKWLRRACDDLVVGPDFFTTSLRGGSAGTPGRDPGTLFVRISWWLRRAPGGISKLGFLCLGPVLGARLGFGLLLPLVRVIFWGL